MPKEIEAKIEAIKKKQPVELPKPDPAEIRKIQISKDFENVGIALNSMAEVSKKVASAVIDNFVKGDKKLISDSKIVANVAIDGAQGLGQKILDNKEKIAEGVQKGFGVLGDALGKIKLWKL